MNDGEVRQKCIYGLHAGDHRYRYLGATAQNAKTRWWEHRHRAMTNHSAPVYEWMRSVGIDNVQIDVIEIVDNKTNLRQREAELIREYLSAGSDLVNQTARDGKPDSMSQASRRRISRAKAGKPSWITGLKGEAAGWTEERRAAQSERIRRYNADRIAA